MHEESKKAT
jgi:hypothetical protein